MKIERMPHAHPGQFPNRLGPTLEGHDRGTLTDQAVTFDAQRREQRKGNEPEQENVQEEEEHPLQGTLPNASVKKPALNSAIDVVA